MSAFLKITKQLPSATKCLTRRIDFINLQQIRNVSSLPRSATSQAKEQQYMKNDRVPPNYSLIYRTAMENYIAWSMHVSSLTAAVIGGAAIYQYASKAPLMDPQLVETTLVMHTEDIYVFALGFLAINAVLRLVVSKLPLRIYKNNDGKYVLYFLPTNSSPFLLKIDLSLDI